ncbi:MAG: hypothetical protein IPM35_33020 [Myxococcales bacterium]|nr:hypothetical protein [Myxococcales bacterium]
MALQLNLSPQEARLLVLHLDRHLHRLDADLVRTDKHELQHALAQEIAALQGIEERLRSISPAEVAGAE